MSFAKSSALRWFERLMDSARRKYMSLRKGALENYVEKLVGLGDVVFPRIARAAEDLARLINRLQITVIESMILASLWFGAIALLISILVVILAG